MNPDGVAEIANAGSVKAYVAGGQLHISNPEGIVVEIYSAVGASQPDGLWVAKNGAWEVPSGKTGVLSVQLVVSSPSIPEADLALCNVRLQPQLMKPGETGNMVISVANESTTPVEGFDWEYTVGGKTVTMHSDLTIAPSGIATETAVISADGLEADMSHDVAVRLLWDADGNIGNDTGSCRLICWETAAPRRVLIEEFTTEHCPNCPRAINTLEQCFEHGYGDSMAVMAHHVGYHEDWLTVEADNELLWFYDPTGASGTYAPAVMLDRTVSGGNVTGIFGDPIDMTSGSYNGGFTVDVNPEWNTDNLQVVAFISAYSQEDVAACRLYNTAVCAVAGSGVEETGTPEATQAEYYTLQGTRAAADARGILIEIRHHADGTSTRSVTVRK